MAGALTIAALSVSLSRASASPSTVYYLALGDSVPVWDGANSYPYQIDSHYSSSTPGLQVVDLAVSGKTTTTMLDDGQMAQAVSFLEQHPGATVLVTIDIGGNDLLPCVQADSSVDVSCVEQTDTNVIAPNLQTILTKLRQAAGPTVPIYGMNYYDPFLGDWLAGGTEQAATVTGVSEIAAIDSFFKGVYAQFSNPIADVESAFDTTDLTDMVSSTWGEIPLAVDKACTLLDISCQSGQTEGFGDDPNNAGAAVIAQAFEQVIGSAITPVTPTTTSTSTSVPAPTTTVAAVRTPTPTTSAIPSAKSGSLALTGAGSGLAELLLAGVALSAGAVVILLACELRRRVHRDTG
ncbi:MAG: SGNH/GDSL hydrolase family protein [Nitrososphaerales archaeon]